MKITVTKTEVYDYDLKKEIRRLKKCFKGEQLQRQMDILHAAFIERDDIKFRELYYALPDCKEHGWSEMEYVGSWINFFGGGNWCREYLVEEDHVVDFEKLEKL
jgi:hypothetical protein